MSKHERNRGRRRPDRRPTPSAPLSPDLATGNLVPTTLTLLRSDADIARARMQRTAALSFRSDFFRLDRAYGHLVDVADGRLTSNKQTLTSLDNQRDRLRSSMTAGRAYHFYLDQFTQQGATTEQILDFFRQAVEINHLFPTQFVPLVRKPRDPIYFYQDVQNLIRRGKTGRDFNERVKKITATPPDWFKGDEKDWPKYAMWRVIMSKYLIPGEFQMGPTVPDGLPDWYAKSPDQPPRPDQVDAEYEGDQQEIRRIDRIKKQILLQNESLQLPIETRMASLTQVIEQDRRTLNDEVGSLTDMVFFLYATQNTHAYSGELATISRMRMADLQKRQVPATKAREQEIARVSNTAEIGLSKEALALFLENKLIEAELMNHASESRLNSHRIATLQLAIDAADGTEQTEDVFRQLEEFFPTTYKALHEDVEPLFCLLSTEERAYLGELLAGSISEPFEPFIWEAAELVSNNVKAVDLSRADKDTGRVIAVVKRHTGTWLLRNWENVYKMIDRTLGGETESMTTTKPAMLQASLSQVEWETAQIQASNLENWHVYYQRAQEDDQIQREHIDGVTLAQRKEVLTELLQQKSIAEDAELLIELLNWLVVLAQDVQSTETEQAQFTRLKLGDGRILYHVDPFKKEAVIVVEKKAA